MCVSAILQAGFREYIYGTSIDHLFQVWVGINLISSQEAVTQSWSLATAVKVLGSIGTEFTDPLFEWQYQENVNCRSGCDGTMGLPGTTTCQRNNGLLTSDVGFTEYGGEAFGSRL